MQKITPGAAKRFTVLAQNDGTAPESLLLHGTAKKPGFTVKYFDGSTEITAEMTGAGFPRR